MVIIFIRFLENRVIYLILHNYVAAVNCKQCYYLSKTIFFAKNRNKKTHKGQGYNILTHIVIWIFN